MSARQRRHQRREETGEESPKTSGSNDNDSGEDDDNEPYETSKTIFNRKLRALYPMIREHEHGTLLPRRWDRNQASSYLEISENGLCVTFKKNVKLKDEKDPSAIVRANVSIPASTGFYYFEIKIVHGHKGCMGIGLSRKNGQLNRMPGWDPMCYGYHGDDGNFFCASGQGELYGPKFGTGDVIGCGVDTMNSLVFFTKNGENLGIASEAIREMGNLYPTVGLKTPGEQVTVNFGHSPFVFDLEKHRRIHFMQNHSRIEKTKLTNDHEKCMNRIVTSFLAYTGSVDTLKVFEQATKQENREDYQFLEERAEVANMVMEGYHGVKIEAKINSYFPNVLDSRPDVHVLIMCLRFVDTAATLSPMTPSCFKKGAKREPGDKSVNSSSFCVPSPSSSAPPSSLSNSSPYVRNPNKRTRSKDDIRSSRTSGDLSPLKKSPVSARKQKQKGEEPKNGDSKGRGPDLAEQFLINADRDILTTAQMYSELNNENEDLEKLKYLVHMGRQIIAMCNRFEMCKLGREIVELSLSTLHSHRKLFDPHPLSLSHRRFISNKVFEMVNDSVQKKSYSELRSLFLAWRGIQYNLGRKDHPAASLSLTDHISNSLIQPDLESDITSVMSSPKDDE